MTIALRQLLKSMVDDPEMSTHMATAKAQTALTLVDRFERLYQFCVIEATCPLCQGQHGCLPNCTLERDFPENYARLQSIRKLFK